MEKHLHIVCLDVPYPPDYGGVFDLFYKMKALHEAGILIHLHCFEYGRGEQQELEKYCKSVKYYSRKTGFSGLSFRVPYIVSSRANKKLLANLLLDNHPILLEGIHCTYFLFKEQLPGRKVFVRLHNVEYEYYRHLAKSSGLLKKVYFLRESWLLKAYERKIASKAVIIAVAPKDKNLYEIEFSAPDVRYLPIFIPWKKIKSLTGSGTYCLYHGNLTVPENEKATSWIIQNMAGRTLLPLIIAGHSPSDSLLQLASAKNIQIEANPSMERMEELISNAHIHILPSFNVTGIKIKILNALYNGRHCIVNYSADDQSGLHSLCHNATSPDDFLNVIHSLVIRPFSENEKKTRADLLEVQYNNENNAGILISWIY